MQQLLANLKNKGINLAQIQEVWKQIEASASNYLSVPIIVLLPTTYLNVSVVIFSFKTKIQNQIVLDHLKKNQVICTQQM